MGARRLLTLTALAWSLVAAGCAGAGGSACFADGRNDFVTPGAKGVDIVETCLDHGPTTHTYTLRAADPIKVEDVQQISWELNVGADRNPDVFLNVVPSGERFTAALATSKGQTPGQRITHEAGSRELTVSYPAEKLTELGWDPGDPYDFWVVTQSTTQAVDRLPDPWLTFEPGTQSSGAVIPAAVAAAVVVLLLLVFVVVRRRRGGPGGEESDSFATVGGPYQAAARDPEEPAGEHPRA